MNFDLRQHINNLHTALLGLPATGAAGFEGLVGVALTEISGVPFRLAGGGSQFGYDGNASYADDAVCFEGKRYDGAIPRTEVLTKIAELSIDERGDTDLWVLGATIQVRAQLVNDARKLGAKSGIAILILDWAADGLPPLAVALAMAQASVAAFLETYVQDRGLASKAVSALAAIGEDEALAGHATRVRAELDEPTTGAGLARQANTRWLTDVCSSKRAAKRFLRQPLSPGDKTQGESAPRSALVDRMTPLLTGTPDGHIGVILGDEGNGKSWLAAQSWLSLENRPLMIVLTADDFQAPAAEDDLTEMLIRTLIRQTDGHLSESARNRWRRKLERWRILGTPGGPRLVVVIDGLNQRPQIDWGWLIEAMGTELDRIGGRLVVTSRTAYYRTRVGRRLLSAVREVNVPEWT